MMIERDDISRNESLVWSLMKQWEESHALSLRSKILDTDCHLDVSVQLTEQIDMPFCLT